MRMRVAMAAGVLMLARVCVAADMPGLKVLPAFGIGVVPPAGWKEQTPEILNEVIGWAEPGKAALTAGAITVRCEPADGNLEANAAELALRYGGAVLDDKVTLDGVPAKVIWISRPGVAVEMRSVVAQRGGLTYTVECTGPAGGLAQAQLDEFVKDFRWEKREAISDHLKEEGPWMAALQGTLSIQRPDVMRLAAPAAMQKPDRFIFMTPEAKGADAEFICVVGLEMALDSRPFSEMSAAYLTALNATDPKAKVQWQNSDGSRRLSNLFAITKTDLTGTPRVVHEIVGIAKIEGFQKYVVVNFLVNTDDPVKRKAYEGAAKRIFDSMKAAGK